MYISRFFSHICFYKGTFCELAAADVQTRRWLRERVESSMCKETIADYSNGNVTGFQVFARPWRPDCLAGIEIWALVLTILSIILGISSLIGVLNGYKPRNHVSYIVGIRPRTKSMLVT